MPAAFRAEVRVEPLAGTGGAAFAVFREGELALVRFLDPRQRGKAFLRRPEGTWLLARGARPVRLGAATSLAAGVSLEELVGLSYARDFVLEAVSRQGSGTSELVTFSLRSKLPHAPYPRVDYVVRADTRRPVRIEHRLASGKLARLLELVAWRPGARPIPAETVAKDLVGGRAPVRIRLLGVEERAATPHLFELGPAGDAARAAP